MPTLDVKKLRMNIGSIKPVRSAAEELADSKLQSNKNIFLQEFQNHPVTKEIEGGESSKNLSLTLGGYGNLFSFIGFQNGSNPTSIVKDMIGSIRLIKKSFSKKSKDGAEISFNIYVPTVNEFEQKTPMPWATGRSWLIGIERGISGFGYFLSRSLSGRSLGGIQADEKIRPGSFRNVSYFSNMYNSFIRRLGGKK